MIAARWRILGFVAALAASSASAQTVIDGNSLNDKGTVKHLWGIDAPDIGHVCADGWDAGKAAAAYLRSLIGTTPVTCEPKASPPPGGRFAICKVDGQDLSAAMASAGMAWAAPNVSAGLQRMYAISGVYAHPCVKAWEWRAGIRTKQ